jgi:hypothetical protein
MLTLCPQAAGAKEFLIIRLNLIFCIPRFARQNQRDVVSGIAIHRNGSDCQQHSSPSGKARGFGKTLKTGQGKQIFADLTS